MLNKLYLIFGFLIILPFVLGDTLIIDYGSNSNIIADENLNYINLGYCGDSMCTDNELCSTCPEDCRECPPTINTVNITPITAYAPGPLLCNVNYTDFEGDNVSLYYAWYNETDHLNWTNETYNTGIVGQKYNCSAIGDDGTLNSSEFISIALLLLQQSAGSPSAGGSSSIQYYSNYTYRDPLFDRVLNIVVTDFLENKSYPQKGRLSPKVAIYLNGTNQTALVIGAYAKVLFDNESIYQDLGNLTKIPDGKYTFNLDLSNFSNGLYVMQIEIVDYGRTYLQKYVFRVSNLASMENTVDSFKYFKNSDGGFAFIWAVYFGIIVLVIVSIVIAINGKKHKNKTHHRAVTSDNE